MINAHEDEQRESAIKDPKRIEVADTRELVAWSLLLQVTPQQVVDAVEAVGPMVTMVALHLNSPASRARTADLQMDSVLPPRRPLPGAGW
jgi:hypothetical protein